MGYGHAGLRPLAVALAAASFRTVTMLILSNNKLGLEGAGHLSLILEKNMAITELDVSGCALGDEGVRVLSQGLQANEGLEGLDLGDNYLSDRVRLHVCMQKSVMIMFVCRRR